MTKRFGLMALCLLVGAGGVTGARTHGAPAQDISPLQDPELMRVQREVWDVWYAGDTARLRQLTPGLITINNGGGSFGDQESTIRASARFHAGGGRLLELSFPDLRAQRFGDVVIIYSTYRSVSVMGRDTTRERGRATEVFVRRGGSWVNPGWHLDSGQ